MNTLTTMQSKVQSYLAERRRLGFELRSPGLALMSFARYVDDRGFKEPVSVEIMSDWAKLDKMQKNTPVTWARRLNLLKPFMNYLRQFEPLTEVPDEPIFGAIQSRLTPHIYHEQEIIDLLSAARGITPTGELRPATYETLFGLIASTGMRISEAVHLLDTDVNLKQGMLIIRETKFTKSRQLPLHSSTVTALRRYRQQRNQYIRVSTELPFFISVRGKRLGHALGLRQVHRVFNSLSDQLGWINRGAHDRPRIHDLRHTFVVRRVMLWHKYGSDIDQEMLALSTYMGHVEISYTYWYLTAVPELMAVAASKFELFAHTLEVGDD